jgi:peptide/nickel transport system permease protein
MIDAVRYRFGLDQPWWVQYGLYLEHLLHLDFGVSFTENRPVFTVLGECLLNTLLLQGAAAVVTWGLAIPLGVWTARHWNSWIDRTLSLTASLFQGVPELLSGLLLQLLAARTGLFPVEGMRSVNWESFDAGRKALDLLGHLALPALAIGLSSLAMHMRQVRSNLLHVLGLEYITTARAKGLDEHTVIYKHALRNAANPLITLFGFTLGGLISGSLIVEILFSWPGLGRRTFLALWTQDQYLALGGVLMVSAMLVLGNLIADVLLAAVDPRIVYDEPL